MRHWFSPTIFHSHRFMCCCIDAVLRDCFPLGYVFVLHRDVENSFVLGPRSNFCKVSQKVEQRWVRNASGHLLSLQNIPQKHSKHKKEDNLKSFESHYSRMNLLTYGTTTIHLFPFLCFLLSLIISLLCNIRTFLDGLSYIVLKFKCAMHISTTC